METGKNKNKKKKKCANLIVSEIRVLTVRPVTLSKANSKLMSFDTIQQHVLQGQQPVESCHYFRSVRRSVSTKGAHANLFWCRDKSGKWCVVILIYKLHKKYDSIRLPSREDLLVLRPKNILFAQQSILSLWNETFYTVLSAFLKRTGTDF